MTLGSRQRTGAAAVAALVATGCPGPHLDVPRVDPPPRYSTIPTPATIPPEPPAGDSPRATGPPSLAPPMPSDSAGAGAAPAVVAAAHLTDQARRSLEGGDDDRALELLEHSLQIDPTAPFAYYYLAAAYLHRQRPAEALVLAERAATLSSPYTIEWTAHSLVLKGHALKRLGKHAQARRAYQQALDIYPNTIPAQKALEDLDPSPR